jgi:hypothetical protein
MMERIPFHEHYIFYFSGDEVVSIDKKSPDGWQWFNNPDVMKRILERTHNTCQSCKHFHWGICWNLETPFIETHSEFSECDKWELNKRVKP